jgi:hypothetical protein
MGNLFVHAEVCIQRTSLIFLGPVSGFVRRFALWRVAHSVGMRGHIVFHHDEYNKERVKVLCGSQYE